MAIVARWDFSNETLVDSIGGETLSLSRAQNTTCRGADGYLQLIPDNTPAYHYAYDGTFIGLQCFGSQGVQRFVYTELEDMAAIEWTKLNCTVSSDAIADPYGNAASADTITDSGFGTLVVNVREAVSVDTSEPIEVSCFIKLVTAGTGNNYFYFDTGAFSGVSGGIVWDLEDPLATPVTVEGSVRSYGVEQYADGWYRFWCTISIQTDGGGSIYAGMSNSSTPQSAYPVDGRTIGMWGFSCRQLDDIGNTEAWDGPLPYTSDGLTYSRDSISISPVAWLPAGDMSYFEEHHMLTTVNTPNPRYSLHIDCSSDASTYLYSQYDTDSYGVRVSNGGLGFGEAIAAGTELHPGINRGAFSVTNADLRVSYNGGTIATSASVIWPLTDARTSMNYDWWFGGGRPLRGYYREFIFWDEVLDDATLTDYTTNGAPSAAFGGTVAGDGGVVWPARANDPRWTQLISDSGITSTGNFTDDVKAALIALSGASGGSLDDLWKKTLAANNVTDISEPYLY